MIDFDKKGLIINGEHEFILSGTFHYFRVPKELWRDRFEKIRAAGFNCVDTYIPWNRHEKDMPSGLDDMSKFNFTELDEWLNMAVSYGFYIIVRPGPFICAEYDRGGYPGWLINYKPKDIKEWTWLRSNCPTYLAWSKHWYSKVLEVTKKYKITERKGQGGIILLQIENEYSHIALPSKVKANCLEHMVNIAQSSGFDIPIFACESPELQLIKDYKNSQLFDSFNFYPDYNIGSLSKRLKNTKDFTDINNPEKTGITTTDETIQPEASNKPKMISELQGGWFSFIWDNPSLLSERENYRKGSSPEQVNNLLLFCIQNGINILNMYVLCGGTNLDSTEGKDMPTSYDYSAPIRENGTTGEKYEKVKAIGNMLKDYGKDIVKSTALDLKYSSKYPDVEVAGRESRNAYYLFLRTENLTKSFRDTISIFIKNKSIKLPYTLEPFGSKLFFLKKDFKNVSDGLWLINEIDKKEKRSSKQYRSQIDKFYTLKNITDKEWQKIEAFEPFNKLGIYDNRTMMYRLLLEVEHTEDKKDRLLRLYYHSIGFGSWSAGNKGNADRLVVSYKGKLLKHLPHGLKGDFIIPAELLTKGKNEFIIYYENAGYMKEGPYMEKEAGIKHAQIIPIENSCKEIRDWQMSVFASKEDIKNINNISELTSTLAFKPIVTNSMEAEITNLGECAAFKRTFNFSQEDIKNGNTTLLINQVGDLGKVFVNNNATQVIKSRIEPSVIDLGKSAKVGENQICVVVQACDWISSKGGISNAFLVPSVKTGILPQSIEISNALQNTTKRLGKNPSVRAEHWESKTKSVQQKTNTPFAFQRILFSLPVQNTQKYLARIEASGNGFIHLNGKPIGRYWNNGKQREFYLPECFLNFDNSEINTLSLMLLNKDNKLGINQIEILSYE